MTNELMLVPKKLLLMGDISPSAKVLYLHILSYAYDQVTCYPSVNTLADCMECSERAVSRYLQELKIYGLIKYVRGYNGKSNRYIIVPIEWVDGERVNEADYDLTESEFMEYASKVKEFYSDKAKPKKNGGKRGGSGNRTKIIKELLEHLKDPNYKLKIGDVAYYFSYKLQEKKDYVYSPKQADFIMLADVFKLDSMSRELALEIIDIYIDNYDSMYKTDKYKYPLLTHLKFSSVFNSMCDMAKISLNRKSTRSGYILTDEAF